MPNVRSRAPGNMAEGSETKRQLGRVVLQRKTPPIDASQEARGDQDRPTMPSPQAQDLMLLLTTLRDGDDVRSVDLRRVVISLSVLSFVPLELARERQLLPLVADDERLLVAISDPGERRAIEQLEGSSGRRVLVCVPLEGGLRDVIESAYAAARAGATSYSGPAALEPAHAPTTGESLLPPVFDPAVATVSRFARDELSGPLGVTLSSAQAASDARHTAPGPAATAAGRKILLVDDSEDIRRLLARVFCEQGYDVVESARGLDALEKVREHQPDVLVLEAMLPEVHGFDLCRRIKASRRYGHVPVVMLSAVYRGWRIAEDLRASYGVNEFLEKPFRVGDVLAAVQRALDGTSHTLNAPDQECDGPGAGQLQSGMDAYARGDLAGAIEQLKRGVALDPLAFRLHYHLGLLYGKQGNVFEAIQALESAVDLRSRDFSTLKNLAVLYQRAGFRLKGAEMWERALVSAPDDETRASIRNHLVSLL